MNIVLVQYAPVWENIEENKQKIDKLLEDLEEEQSCLVFPELTLTGFSMASEKLAETKEGDSIDYFKNVAVKKKSHIIAGFIEKYENRCFNSLVHINTSGDTKAIYRKIHPFTYSTENQHYAPGENLTITDIQGIKTGLTICYDLRFPELFRYYAKSKVELIINVANWPVTRISHFNLLLRARAVENQCYVAGVNRTGNDPKLQYVGNSAVYDPMGNEIAFGDEGETLIKGVVDLNYVNEVREKLPFLDDMKLI